MFWNCGTRAVLNPCLAGRPTPHLLVLLTAARDSGLGC